MLLNSSRQAYNQWVKTLRSIALLAAAALASCLFQLEYNVGGTVTGLKGTGLVLQDNSRDDLRVNANGAFTFSSRIAKGNTYAVTVKTQPSNPAQTCTVRDGSGTMAKANITGVVINCSQAGRYAYVANQTDGTTGTAGTISAFSIDSANGFLTPIARFASSGAGPVALVVDPNGAFLYVANNTSNSVGIFAINDATGALTVTDFSVATGAGPAALCVDPTGRYLYVANSGSNTVSAFAINNGFATPVGSPVAAGNQPVALQTDPGGNFLYVTDFAGGNVTVLAIDGTTGALTADVSGSPFGGGSGAGAVSIAIDPAGTFAYVANEKAATISAFSIDSTTGALTASGSPLSTASAPMSIAVDPAGSFVYAANVTISNDVASYAIASSGALNLSSTAGAQSLPVAVAVDPSGQFVYVANQNSGNVSVFTVDAATGALAEVAGSPFPAGSGARSIAID
jgi:6-phosphogluconolactonase